MLGTVLMTGFALGRSAPAKEHTAACPELAGMIGRVRISLEAATGQRQRGSSLGAYQVLRSTTASMVRESAGDHCGALGPTLTAALVRATAARTALDASVELDLGLDAALSLATDGHLPYASAPPKMPLTPSSPASPASPSSPASPASPATSIGEAALYGQGCPDLFPIAVRLEGPPQRLAERVKAVLADLDAHPRCARVRRVLAQASAERLPHAVDSVRLDEPDEIQSPTDVDLLTRCPELPLVMERLGAAIELGAPQYNAGDAEACRHTYEVAARAVTTQIVPADRCPEVRAQLAIGLARAEGSRSPNQAAWALRRSFDAILAGTHGAAP